MAVEASTPDKYFSVFTNATGAVSASNYVGLHTLTSYDSNACAKICDETDGCRAFNIYIERDPSLDANEQNCPNPPSTINYRCTLWGTPIVASQATATGQWRAKFQVAVTGSNGTQTPLPQSYIPLLIPQIPGYNLAPASTLPGFQPPTSLGSASINAPLNPPSYMGYQWFPFSQSQGFSTQTCASYCSAQTTYNRAHPSPKDCTYVPCTFFNAYILSKNGIPHGLYCALYNATWDAQYATNRVVFDQQNNNYSVSHSYGYSVTYPAPQPAYASTCGAPFIRDGGFDALDLNTYPYLEPYWNFSTTGNAEANGGWSPGFGGSRAMFGARLGGGANGVSDSSNPSDSSSSGPSDNTAPSVTLSQSLTTVPHGTYTLTFQYKFDAGMEGCQIALVFPGAHSPGPHRRLMTGLQPGEWYGYSGLFFGGDTPSAEDQVLAFVFSCPGGPASGGIVFVDSIEITPMTLGYDRRE